MERQDEERMQALVLKIFQLDDLLKAAANEIARPAGQTGARWQVLNALDQGPGTAADIARLKQTSRQGVQRIVNELLHEGVVAAGPNPRHRRYPLLQLTARGRAVLEEIRRQRGVWTAQVLQRLEGGVDEAAVDFLGRFQAAVETVMPMRLAND
jgi:DNA-binding MarR family transcriptional regulator